MQTQQSAAIGNSHLSCLFGDTVISLPLGERPTLADIADILSEPSLSRHGSPLAIKIAWPPRASAAARPHAAAF